MLDIRWATEPEMVGAAQFFARTIALDDAYISHGEIQTGLSVDGVGWVGDLEARMIEDLCDVSSDRRVAIARLDETLVGGLIFLSVATARVRYVVIEDLAVDPALRGQGVGARLIAFAEAHARAEGAVWAFLESGLNNHRAHDFFAGHGFAPMSKVFVKHLTDEGQPSEDHL